VTSASAADQSRTVPGAGSRAAKSLIAAALVLYVAGVAAMSIAYTLR